MIWKDRRRTGFGGLRAIRAGNGPRLVLLHGVGLRAEAWSAQIDDLARDHTVIAPDMAGHGHSAPLPEPALADFTDTVADAIDEPVVVIGHSMGAMMALDLAARHATKVRGIVALNAIFRRSPAAAAAVRARAETLDPATVPDPEHSLARWFGDAFSPERSACETWLRGVDPAAYRVAYGIFAGQDGPRPDALRHLQCPALFATGGNEPNSTPAMSRAMAALARRGQAEIIPGAAHMMPMTHPAQVNAMIRAFINSSEMRI